MGKTCPNNKPKPGGKFQIQSRVRVAALASASASEYSSHCHLAWANVNCSPLGSGTKV